MCALVTVVQTCALPIFIFADGAGAVVVGPSDTPAIGPVVWGSGGEHYDYIRQNIDWGTVLRTAAEHGEVPPMPHMTMEGRSEERRGGTECGSMCRMRWEPEHKKKKTK